MQTLITFRRFIVIVTKIVTEGLVVSLLLAPSRTQMGALLRIQSTQMSSSHFIPHSHEAFDIYHLFVETFSSIDCWNSLPARNSKLNLRKCFQEVFK